MTGLSSKSRLPAVLVAAAVVATSLLLSCRERTKPPATKPTRATTQPATTQRSSSQTQPAGQRKFEDALIFVDNYLSGVTNAAIRTLSSQGWVECRRPGEVGRVAWQYLRTTGRGDEYVVTRAFPPGVGRGRWARMEVTYAGVPLMVFEGKNQRVVLLPGRLKNVHTDGLKVDDALTLLKESKFREVIFNMDLLATPAALPALVEIVRDVGGSKYARKNAAAVLGDIGSREARDALIMVLGKTRQPDFDMGGSMWGSLLNAIGDCIERESEKQLLDDLGHGHPQVRWLAASQLGRRKSVAAVPALIALLDDKHPVRLGATWALGEIGDVRGDAVLFAIVEGRRGGGSVVSAIEAMGKIGTDRALAAVKSIKTDHPGHWMARKVLAGWGSNFRKPATTRPAAASSSQAKPAANAGKVSRVKSLAQLRSLTPARKAKDWELRVGWADSGVENAPWKLLYLHWLYTGDRKDRDRPIQMENWGYYHRVFDLGPVAWDMHYTPPNRLTVRRWFLVDRSPRSELIRSSTERLYCAVVPTPLAGTYELTIGGKVPVIATIPVKKAPELSWLPLLVPRPVRAKPGDAALTMAGELVAATPAYHEDPVFFRSGVPRAGDEQKLFAKMLPGQCPGLANWRLYENDKQTLGIHARMTPLRLSAEIAAGKLLLHYKGFTPQQPDREFLAQWRINGKVVTAEPPGEERRPQPFAPQLKAVELSRKKENEEATVEIPLVLPAWLARRVEAGDKVALTVLFSPTGWRRIVHPANITSRSNLSRATIGCSQPVMSGQVTFTVTKAMLAEADSPQTQAAARSAERAAVLKKNIGKFRLVIGYHGPQKDKDHTYKTLDLSRIDLPHQASRRTARINAYQAGKIIDHLAAEGFLARALDMRDKEIAPPKPSYTLTVTCGAGGPQLYEVLGWDLKMLKRLDALRMILDRWGSARYHMDTLLRRLWPQRWQWEDLGARTPAERLSADLKRLYEPAYRGRIMTLRKKQVMKTITSYQDLRQLFEVRFWCAGNRDKISADLVALLTNTKRLGLNQIANGVPWEQAKTSEAIYRGAQWVVDDNLFMVAGRASWVLKEITGANPGTVTAKSTPKQLRALAAKWRAILAKMGPEAKPPLKPDYKMGRELVKAIKETYDRYQSPWRVLRMLREEFGARGEAILPGLAAVVEKGDERSRPTRLHYWVIAAYALGDIGDKRAAPFLAARLRDPYTRQPDYFFVSPMGRLGVKAVVPRLVRWLREDDKEDLIWSRYNSTWISDANVILKALQAITGKDFGAVTNGSVDRNYKNKKQILAAINKWWAAEGRKIYAPLEPAVKSRPKPATTRPAAADSPQAQAAARKRAIETLGRTKEPSREVLLQLIAALKDPSWAVRTSAAEVLGRFGPRAISAMGALAEALGDTDVDVRTAAGAARAAIDLHNRQRNLALLRAVDERNPAQVARLLKEGADVNTTDPNGNTLLRLAVIKGGKDGDEKIVRLLLAKRPNVNARDNLLGATPLHGAMRRNLVRLLLDHGADVNARNANGATPIHKYVGWARKDLIKEALVYKPDLSLVDKEGRTALDRAARMPEILELLKAHAPAAAKPRAKPATTRSAEADSPQAQPATRDAEPKRGEDPEILAVVAKLRTMKPRMQGGHLAGMIGRMAGLPGGGTFIDLPPDKGYTLLAYCLGDKDLSARVLQHSNPVLVRKVHARVVTRGNATELAHVYDIMANNLANFWYMKRQFGKAPGAEFVAAQADARKHLAHRDPRVRVWAGQFLLHLVPARPDENDRLDRHNVALAARIIDKDLKSNPEAFLRSLEDKAADMYPSHRGGYLYGRRLAFRDWLGGKTSTYEPSSDDWAKRPFIQGFRAGYAATMAALERHAKACAEQAGDSRELARTIAAIWALKLRQDPQKYLAEEDHGGRYDRFRASAAAGYLYGHKQGLRSLTPIRRGGGWNEQTKIYVPTAKAGDWPFIIGFLSGYRDTLLLGRPDPLPAGPAPRPATRAATTRRSSPQAQPATRDAETKRGEAPEILAVAAKLRTMEPDMRVGHLAGMLGRMVGMADAGTFIDLPADKGYTLLAYCLGDKDLSASALRLLRLGSPALARKVHARAVIRGNATELAHVYNIMANSLANVSFLKSQPGKDVGVVFVTAQADARKHLAHRDPRVRVWAGQFLLHLVPVLPDEKDRGGRHNVSWAARIADKDLKSNPEAFLGPREGKGVLMYESYRGGYLYGRRLAFRDWLGGKTNTYKPSRGVWAKQRFIHGFRAGYAATMAALKRHANASAEQAGDSHELARTIAAIPAVKLRQDPQEYLVQEDLGDKYDRFWASSAAGYLYGHRQALRCLSLLWGDRTWKSWPDHTKIYIRTAKAGDCPFIDGFLSGYRDTLLLGRPDPRPAGPAAKPTTRAATQSSSSQAGGKTSSDRGPKPG